MPLLAQLRCVLTGVGLGSGELCRSRLQPVAVAAGGRGDAREVGRLAACGPVGGRRWPPYSVPGRVAHGVGIGGAQVRGLRHDHQWQQVFGDVVPIQNVLQGGADAVKVGHVYLRWLRTLK